MARQLTDNREQQRLVFSRSPFMSHVGVEVRPSAHGVAAVRLCDGEHLNNHVGSRHAGALFALGDAAGAALVEATFPPQVVTAAAPESERISYERMAKGPVTASARLVDGGGADPVTAIASGRRQAFDVDVVMSDEQGATVAQMTVTYALNGSVYPRTRPSRNGHGPEKA